MPQIFDLQYIISTYGYLGIFIIVFLESGIFFALPGDSLLFMAGLLVAVLDLDLFLLIPLVFTATFLGGIVGYEIGVNLDRLKKFSLFRKILKEENLNKTHRFFEKHGKFAVILSRFVPMARTFIPIIAGIVRMDYPLFIRYSLISSLLWSTSMTLLGYFLGQLFPHIKEYVSFVILLIIFISVLPMIWEMRREEKEL